MMTTAPQFQLRDLLMGTVLTQAVQVAAELGVADALANDSKDCSTLAAELGVEPSALRRLLRALAGCGVFEQGADGRFANSTMSEHLRADSAASLRGLALAYGDPAIWRAWEGLLKAIRAGGSAFEHVHQMPLFEHLKVHPDSARRFDAAMASSASIVNDALANAYDWGRHSSIVDVGGGTGGTLTRILGAAPQTTGIVFDLPHAAAKATQALAQSNVAQRCSAVAGDFLTAIPAGADAYLLKHILHDWDDDICMRLLKQCHGAMPRDATLLVCERILGQHRGNHYAALTDVVMLALTQSGRERTEQEYAALLEAAGFVLVRVLPVGDELSLIQAAKA
jgi:O-methyltransferase domain/Dimerisation domain